MGKLLQRLKDASRSAVYRVRRDAEVLDALREGGFSAKKVSLKGVDTKAGLLDRLAQALGFPDWFGGNWDAVEDCLAEMPGYLLFYDFHRIPGAELGVLIDVLGSSAEFWAGKEAPFFAVFVDPGASLALADLFREP